VIVNASLAWNNGQLWFQHTYFPDGNVYTFTESNPANATVTYAMPSLCAGLAVGWTDYKYAPSSITITSAHTYLDPSIFNAGQEENATARAYAFRLALHELGRVLGLGNVIDGKDIMDPLATPSRATQPPMISTLDLFAVHVLASESTISPVIVLNTDQYQLLNAWSLLAKTNGVVSSVSSSAQNLADLYSPRKILSNDTPNVDSTNRPADQLVFSGIYLTMFMVAGLVYIAYTLTLHHSGRLKPRVSPAS